MRFYTNVRKSKNSLHIREVVDGKRVSYKVDDFRPCLYHPFRKGETPSGWRTLDGKDTVEQQFDTIMDAEAYLRSYMNAENVKIYGNIGYANQWIAQTYPEEIQPDLSKIVYGIIDIETTCEDGFPDDEDPKESIIAITFYRSDIDKYLVFTDTTLGTYVPKSDDVKHFPCNGEEMLLRQFLVQWTLNYVDVISGWNIGLFDIPYLIARMYRVLGARVTKLMSPWKEIVEREIKIFNRTKKKYILTGIDQLDYLDLYKKFTYKAQESYKLDNIAFVELKEKKLAYDEYESLHLFYKGDYDKFIDYNVRDAHLIKLLDNKMKLLNLAMTVAYKAKCNYEDVFAQTKVWDTLIYNYLRARKIVIPPKPSIEKTASYTGAYVKDPVKGKHHWVVSLDVNSLYPSLMRQLNLSPETLMENIDHVALDVEKLLDRDYDLTDLPSHNISLAASGYSFDNSKRGFVPELIEMLYSERVVYKKKMLEEKQKYAEDPNNTDASMKASEYRNFEQAIKILLNSVYGAFGSSIFRYSDPRLAESITITGQLVIKTAERALNAFLNKFLSTHNVDYIQAVDTDSSYVVLETLVTKLTANKQLTKEQIVNAIDKFVDDKLEAVLKDAFEDLRVYMNHYEQQIVMKREVIAESAIWVAKKKYVMNVWDAEGVRYKTPELKIMGLEAIKSSTPYVCRQKIIDAMKIMLDGEQHEVQKFINDFRNQFNDLDPGDISFPRSVSNLEDYRAIIKPELAKIINETKDSDPTLMVEHHILNGEKSTPIHVRGALYYNHALWMRSLDTKYQTIKSGDKIKFCYLIEPNPLQTYVVAFPNSIPKELGLERFVDRQTMFEKTFIAPTKLLLDVIGWSIKDKPTLEEFLV